MNEEQTLPVSLIFLGPLIVSKNSGNRKPSIALSMTRKQRPQRSYCLSVSICCPYSDSFPNPGYLRLIGLAFGCIGSFTGTENLMRLIELLATSD